MDRNIDGIQTPLERNENVLLWCQRRTKKTCDYTTTSKALPYAITVIGHPVPTVRGGYAIHFLRKFRLLVRAYALPSSSGVRNCCAD